jgi:hypothetical protein
MKKITFLFLLVTSLSFSQNLNDYKYALVPSKFSFLRETNQYNLNVMTKLFMEKYGFITFMDNETYSEDFAINNFNKVYVDLDEKSTMFKTTIKVVLKDLTNKVIYTSGEGTSRNKEYKIAYQEALRGAFNTLSSLNHNYVEKTKNQSEFDIKKSKDVEVPSDKDMLEEKKVYSNSSSNNLLAQPITNGFQIINAEPKVIYKIFKTSTKDFYIATKGTIQGVFFSRNNEWIFEYYQNDKLVSEKVEVKF